MKIKLAAIGLGLVLLNHVVMITHPIFIWAVAAFFIMVGLITFLFNDGNGADNIYIDNISAFATMLFSGVIAIIIELFIPYGSGTSLQLPLEVRTIFLDTSQRFMWGFFILIGSSVLIGFSYYLFKMISEKRMESC